MRKDAPGFIPIAAPEIGDGEIDAVVRVLRSGRLAQGPEVESLEGAFARACRVEHCVAVSNGTAALQVALHAAGIGPGDEVLVPAFTFAATANAVVAVGAKPVFVDIGSDFLIDLDDAGSRVGPATAAVMPVHLYGLMVEPDGMRAFADRHGLALIEDAAQAHLASRDGHIAGSVGIGAFSLYATKNMMSGEGGLVTTRSEEVARRVRLFRNHGMASRYEHIEWGLNLRMTDLAAAIARVQLSRLPAANEARRANARVLTDRLPEMFETPRVPGTALHVFHQYTVRVPADVRDRLVERFRELGIGADVYYPTPVHRQPSFDDPEPRPQAEAAARQVISLPVHPGVGEDGLERIVEAAATIAGEL